MARAFPSSTHTAVRSYSGIRASARVEGAKRPLLRELVGACVKKRLVNEALVVLFPREAVDARLARDLFGTHQFNDADRHATRECQ